MAKRRHGEPEKFQFLPVDARPASGEVVAVAIRRFADRFVIAAKRERVVAMLLHKQRGKRSEAIQTVYKSIDPTLQSELEGNTGFPQQLMKRFGDLLGVLVEESSARHAAIAGAASLAATGFGAIFIADTQPIAILFHEVGCPTLCS